MSTSATSYAPAAPPPSVPRVHDAPAPCLHAHLNDVGRIKTHPAGLRSRFRDFSKRNIVAAYALFLVKGTLNWLSAFIFSPATAFTDPVNTSATLIVYPVINIVLGVLVAVLYVGSKLGGGWVIQLISDNYADGYSMANWVRASSFSALGTHRLTKSGQANPDIFCASSREAIDAARPFLTGQGAYEAGSSGEAIDLTLRSQSRRRRLSKLTRASRMPTSRSSRRASRLSCSSACATDSPPSVRTFSVPLAKALLLMSSIVYERNDKLVKEAADIFDRTQKKYTPGTHAYDVEMKRAEEKLLESEAKIKVQVRFSTLFLLVERDLTFLTCAGCEVEPRLRRHLGPLDRLRTVRVHLLHAARVVGQALHRPLLQGCVLLHKACSFPTTASKEANQAMKPHRHDARPVLRVARRRHHLQDLGRRLLRSRLWQGSLGLLRRPLRPQRRRRRL